MNTHWGWLFALGLITTLINLLNSRNYGIKVSIPKLLPSIGIKRRIFLLLGIDFPLYVGLTACRKDSGKLTILRVSEELSYLRFSEVTLLFKKLLKLSQ